MLYYLCMTPGEQNLNNLYYKTLDENFNKALSLFERKLPHDELLQMLDQGNIVEKQISALKIDSIKNNNEAKILAKNLTGQDGKIREAVALKIYELLNQGYTEYFYDRNIYDILLNAIVDVNSNVCRNIISSFTFLKENNDFCAYFASKLIDMTRILINKVKTFEFQDGKYKVNKEVFKLYWCLEAIAHFTDYITNDTLKSIINETKSINEYTIREKTAKILANTHNDAELLNVRNQLKQDKNYYVRRF